MSHSNNKRNTTTKSGGGGSKPPKATFSDLKPDEIQVLLLYRKAKALREECSSDIKSLSIDLQTDPILVVTKSDDNVVAADEYIRQRNRDDPVVISNLRLSQVIARAKARLKKDITSLSELSPQERATVCKSNRSFLEKEKEKKGKESSSASTSH